VTAPAAAWVPVQTNSFDGAGNFSNSIPVNLTLPTLFYRISVP
jgi:hypothetical protein